MKSPGYGLRKKNTRGNKWMINTRTNSCYFFQGETKTAKSFLLFSCSLIVLFCHWSPKHWDNGGTCEGTIVPMHQYKHLHRNGTTASFYCYRVLIEKFTCWWNRKILTRSTFFYFNIKYLQCDITTTRLTELFLSTSWDISTFSDTFSDTFF